MIIYGIGTPTYPVEGKSRRLYSLWGNAGIDSNDHAMTSLYPNEGAGEL
jgi:hypothetical protein